MQTENPQEYIIIVAAGTGSRFGASVPKQYCSLAGEPVLMHTLKRISLIMPAATQLLVISREMETLWLDLCRSHNYKSPEYTFGGSTRFHSVKAALNLLASRAADNDIVYVHDAARPLLCPHVAERLRHSVATDAGSGAVPAIAMADSIRMLQPDGTSAAVDRNLYKAVQTPQAFRFGRISRAYSQEFDDFFTDDASVVERYFRRPVDIVEGSPDTLKITNARDLAVVSALL